MRDTARRLHSRLRFGATVAALGTSFLLGCQGDSARLAQPEAGPRPAPHVERVRLDDLVEEVSASFGTGHSETLRRLRDAGLGEVLDDIARIDGQQLHDLSSDAVLEEVVRRAEAHTPGQGERVAAYLYQQAEAEFGAVRTDPAFGELRGVLARTARANLDPARFRFASAAAARNTALPPLVQRAVEQLATVYSGPNLSSFRGLALRTFRGQNLDFDRIVARSSSSKDAIALLFEASTPPPTNLEAAEFMLRETVGANAALHEHGKFLRTLHEVRGELGLEQLDPELREYVRQESRIPSRIAQAREARQAGLLAVVPRPDDDLLLRQYRRGFQADAKVASARKSAAQQYSDYVVGSFGAPPDVPAAGQGSGMGGGGGGGIDGGGRRPGDDVPGTTARPDGGPVRPSGGGGYGSGRAYTVDVPSVSYPGVAAPSAPVSRSFATAIRSSRAARGIAAGGPVSSSVSLKPLAAAWMANHEDGRFGRLVIQLDAGPGREPVIVTSRTLFADSFYPAVSLLWEGHYGSTSFREGEILVVMSMDPFAVPDPQRRAELERRTDELMRRAREATAADPDTPVPFEMELEAAQLQMETDQEPRRIVHHPALFGRELAWSAARIDFALINLETLSTEASITNGGQPLPSYLLDFDVSEAGTWQFFERQGDVRLVPGTGGLQRLSVVSSGPLSNSGESTRSHFAISMFALDNQDPTGLVETEGRRLPELESRLQPMLDWLATNHHDFIRLNDFSEALSLLRWLKGEGVAPILVDLDGEGPEIATPNQMVIGVGPKIGT
jgi:hypothetical protein